MRGHLQQRGPDSWRPKVFIGQSNDGKRRYVERTVRGSRGEAETALARLVVEAADGRYVAAAPMTFGELLDRWRGHGEPVQPPHRSFGLSAIAARNYLILAGCDR